MTKYTISFEADLDDDEIVEEQLLLGSMYDVQPDDVKITKRAEKYRTFNDPSSLAENDRFVEGKVDNKQVGW